MAESRGVCGSRGVWVACVHVMCVSPSHLHNNTHIWKVERPPVPIYGEEACPCLGPAPQALQTLLIGPRPAEAPPRPALFESGVEKARLEAVLGAGGRGLREGGVAKPGWAWPGVYEEQWGDGRGLVMWEGLGEGGGVWCEWAGLGGYGRSLGLNGAMREWGGI